MNEQWYAILDRASGEPISFATVLAAETVVAELQGRFEVVPIAQQPDRQKRFDKATKTMVDIPPEPDRLEAFAADPTVVALLDKLTKGERAALLEKLRAAL